MKCEQLKEHLVEYLYDELPDELKSEVEGALAECPECAAEYAEMRLVHELVASAPSLDVPAQVHNNILREARLEAGKVTAKRESKAFSFAAFFQSPAFASVFVIFLVVTVGLVLNRQGAQSPETFESRTTVAENGSETAVATLEPTESEEELADELTTGENQPDEPGSLDGEFVAQGPEQPQFGTNAATAPLDRAPEGLIQEESESVDNLGRASNREAEVIGSTDQPGAEEESRAQEERQAQEELAQIVIDGRSEREATRRAQRERERDRERDEGRAGDPEERREELGRTRSRASDYETTVPRESVAASPEPEPETAADDDLAFEPEVMADRSTADDRTVEGDEGNSVYGFSERENTEADPNAPRPVVTETAQVDESRNDTEWNRAYEDTQDPGVYDDDADEDEEVVAVLESATSGSVGEMNEQLDTQDEAYWDIPAQQGFNMGSGASGQATSTPPTAQGEAAPLEDSDGTAGLDYEQTAAVEPLTAIYDGAITRYNDGSYRSSIQEFDNFLQAAPTTNNYYSLALYTQGLAFIRLGNYSRAVRNLERLVNSDPGFEQLTDARYQLANAYELNGQLDEALELYRELGRESGAYGDYDEAVERVQQRRRSRTRDDAGEQYYDAEEAAPMNSIEVE